MLTPFSNRRAERVDGLERQRKTARTRSGSGARERATAPESRMEHPEWLTLNNSPSHKKGWGGWIIALGVGLSTADRRPARPPRPSDKGGGATTEERPRRPSARWDGQRRRGWARARAQEPRQRASGWTGGRTIPPAHWQQCEKAFPIGNALKIELTI